jgi:hypothetical protein
VTVAGDSYLLGIDTFLVLGNYEEQLGSNYATEGIPRYAAI